MTVFWRRSRKSMFATVFCTALLTTSMLLFPTGSTETNAVSSTLRVSILQDMPDFNIYNLGSDSYWKNMILSWPIESLAVVGLYSVPYPLLAQSWTFDENTLTIDIYLREGVLFHDGQEMTAEDVHYSYLMARDGTTYSDSIIPAFDADDNNWVTEAELNAGIQIMSSYHVRMVMAKPYGQFFSKTLTVPVMPKHIWQNHVDYENRVDVTWGTDPAAVIATGPFYYAEGVAFDHRVLDKNTQYWGQSFVLPDGCRTYPPNVDRLHFSIEANIDSAINALRSGEIDHIATPIPPDPNKLALIDSDPRIDLFYPEDAGYFYLAFNMKKEPFGSLDFRRAVSHLIDKTHIVDSFMGGFGAEGTTAVSPYFGYWHNPALTDYVYDDPDDPLTTIPEDILDSAGFWDTDGDGWRNLPDGSVMDKITILAPPEDYDPVRIRSMEMIANALVKVGINAEAEAVDFNTLVAKLVAFDYQMLIAGWNFRGYTECVSVLYDIYGPAAAGNSWAFWSDTNPNPFYSDLGEVSTLADEETMMLVDYLADLEDGARATFNIAEQIDYVKEGQEVVLDAVPCNILYHRVNVMATSTAWTGWVPHMGALLNRFSLSELSGGGVDRIYDDAGEGVNVALSAPRTLEASAVIPGHVVVIDDHGLAVPNATVTMTFEPLSPALMDVVITPPSGLTDNEGVYEFTITGTIQGAGVVRVSAASGVYSDEDAMIVTVSAAIPTTLTLHASIEATVMAPPSYAEISLSVLDQYGQPVEGAEISVDEKLLDAGIVTPSTVVTDATGSAAMTYGVTPDGMRRASHTLDRVLLTVSKDGYKHADSAYFEVLAYNDALPDWTLVNIVDVTTTALSAVVSLSTVTIHAVDDEGNALSHLPLVVEYTNDSYVSMPVTSITTDGAGFASFDVEAAAGAPTGAFSVAIGNASTVNTVPASVTFTHLNGAPGEEMYGGYIVYDQAANFMPVIGSLSGTAYVWDSTGVPAEGKAALIVPAAMEGFLVDSEQAEWNSLNDYTGIVVTTSADDRTRLTSGPFSVPGYSNPWGILMEGVDMIAGEVELTLNGVDIALSDLLGEVVIVPEASGDFDWITGLHVVEGQTVITGGYAYGRSYEVLSASHVVPSHFVRAMRDYYDTAPVIATVTDEHNQPVEGAAVFICQPYHYPNTDYGVLEYDIDYWTWSCVFTDASGDAEVTVIAVSPGYVVSDSFVAADVAAIPSPEGCEITLMSQSQLFILPQKCKVDVTPITTPVPIGEDFVVEASILNLSADGPLDDMVVSMYAGTEDTVIGEYVTGADGMASFLINTSGIVALEAGFIPVTLSAVGPGYCYASYRMMVPFKNPRPEITISEPAEGEIITSSTVTISGVVTDLNGVASVSVTIDGGGPHDIPIAVGDTTVPFEYTAHDLDDGPHNAVVQAVDMLDVTSTELRAFIVSTSQFVLVRYAGPAHDSAVGMSFQPSANGLWGATIENNGLSGVAIVIYEVDGGEMTRVARLKVGFQGDSSATAYTEPVSLVGGQEYLMVFTPLGPEGGSALVIPMFEMQH
ncbi:MAG: hypothetical protein JSU93_02715 [Methanobacteriota archaeon]|nr:MAG: hypothetical protein JSU93_02715 [Euryarchaeota archaeon]